MKSSPVSSLALLLSVGSGSIAALIVTLIVVQPQLNRVHARLDELGQATTTPLLPPVVPIEVVPLESRPLLPAYPKAFTDRRLSQVLSVIRRSRTEIPFVAEDRILGSAVSLTSDGWLATSKRAVENLRLNDLAVAWNGKTYQVSRAIRDTSTDIVYLKINVTNLPVTNFTRASDVQNGTAVWTESRSGQLRADLIIDDAMMSISEPIASEKAARRFVLQGNTALLSGSAVWDGGGKLIGITDESKPNGTSVIPMEDAGTTLAQLIGTGEIRRPLLGVRGIDLAHVTLDTASSTLPSLGTWVRSVAPGTPAYRNLIENDVIERVERDILDGTADLGETLHDYRSGATVTFYGTRNGEAFQASITLGSQNTAEAIK